MSLLDGYSTPTMSCWPLSDNLGQVYFMTPDPQKCLSESKRVLKEGGVLTCSSWQGSDWMDLMNLLPQVRSDKKPIEMPKAWCNWELMKGELEKAVFKDVQAYQVETEMKFERYDPCIDIFVDKMPHMIAMMEDFSADERAKTRALMKEEMKKISPQEPGSLRGVALVAVGRK